VHGTDQVRMHHALAPVQRPRCTGCAGARQCFTCRLILPPRLTCGNMNPTNPPVAGELTVWLLHVVWWLRDAQGGRQGAQL
jgi:hypothetical protein